LVILKLQPSVTQSIGIFEVLYNYFAVPPTFIYIRWLFHDQLHSLLYFFHNDTYGTIDGTKNINQLFSLLVEEEGRFSNSLLDALLFIFTFFLYANQLILHFTLPVTNLRNLFCILSTYSTLITKKKKAIKYAEKI
jgi:hypothetical protein